VNRLVEVLALTPADYLAPSYADLLLEVRGRSRNRGES
jgi:hypothetical protein